MKEIKEAAEKYAKEHLKQNGWVNYPDGDFDEYDKRDYNRELNLVIAGAEYALREKEEWISVKERLPEPEVEVLTIDIKDGDRVICWIDGDIGGWYDHISGRNTHVTHWQPLPSAPTRDNT